MPTYPTPDAANSYWRQPKQLPASEWNATSLLYTLEGSKPEPDGEIEGRRGIRIR
jgi:hypothetical protein